MDLLVNQKEKSDMIIEPFQVMIQLSLLNQCPIGTKVSISNNILYLQRPTYFQGVTRWWNNDNKDDLYYLFQAFRRFVTWYNVKEDKIIKYILEQGISGINKLIQTYEKSEKPSIVQTLKLYQKVLSTYPNSLLDIDNNNLNDSSFKKVCELYNDNYYRVVYNSLVIIESEKNETHKLEYIKGIEQFLNPVYYKIRNWINSNLTY